MRRIGEHAVVIGGSLGGLLTARVLAERYDRVTVVDRDALPHDLEGRRAVPQGRHAHALLPHGQACLEALMPGLCEELVAGGAPPATRSGDALHPGRPPVRARLDGPAIHPRRPSVHRGPCAPAGALPAGGRSARPLRRRGAHDERRRRPRDRRADPAPRRRQRGGDARRRPRRRGHRPRGAGPGLAGGDGLPAPAEQRLRVDVAYASRHLRLPAGALAGDRFVLVGARPELPRTLFLFAQEDDRWILSLGGTGLSTARRRPGRPPRVRRRGGAA